MKIKSVRVEKFTFIIVTLTLMIFVVIKVKTDRYPMLNDFTCVSYMLAILNNGSMSHLD